MANKMSKPDLWSRLELRHLLALDAIAREGSFWAAADALECSQSAVSQQVALLERIVGHRLVERSRGRREVSGIPSEQVFPYVNESALFVGQWGFRKKGIRAHK